MARQTVGFLRVSAPNRSAPSQVRFCATDDLPAAEHISPLCGRSQGQTQGQRLLVSVPVPRRVRPLMLFTSSRGIYRVHPLTVGDLRLAVYRVRPLRH